MAFVYFAQVDQRAISAIRSGDQNPRADLIAAFWKILGIEAEWWLDEPTRIAITRSGSS